MSKKKAASAIGILIALLITALLFLHFVGNFINKKDKEIRKQNQEKIVPNQELEQKLDELQQIRNDSKQEEINEINELKEKF